MAEQTLERRHLVGIDPAAETFTAALVVRLDEGAEATKTFSNTEEGFAAFEAWLNDREAVPSQTLVCVENTGVYSEALCYSLHERGFTVALIAPHKIAKAFDEGPKNDQIDSQKVAEYAWRYLDKLSAWQPQEVLLEQVKTLLATREQLIKQKTAAQNSLQALRRKVVQTPVATGALEATAEHLATQIETLMEELKRLIGRDPHVAQMVALVMSLPGAGLLLAAHMLVLTEGFTEGPHYRPLAARLGICPQEHQSGTSVWRPARTRGYGPAMVRKLLYLAARSVVTHKERFERYYRRKCAEGKPERLVLNNVANKLLRILCGMIKNKQPYIEGYQSVNPMLLRNA